jgi:hypothetical protein
LFITVNLKTYTYIYTYSWFIKSCFDHSDYIRYENT